MTELLSYVLEAASRLPDERQDYLARAVLKLLEAEMQPEPTDPEDIEAIKEGLAQSRRGEFAKDENIEAAYRRIGP
jgi:predicted transcriptional regulator